MQISNVVGLALEVMSIPAAPAGRSGPTLVFLHEGLGSISQWRDWPAQLCAQLQLPGLVYSRQGYGASTPVHDVRGAPRVENGVRQGRLLPDYMHHEALTVLPALLQAQGIERPILVGHSDGGTIALLHASQHPVTACIVMAPHVMVEDIAVQAITQARDAYTQGGLRARLAQFHADVDGAFWQWNDVWLSEAFRSFDICTEIETLTAPLLAIQGEDDAYGTMAQMDELARHVPHAQLLKLPHCGHSPHKDQPAQVNAAIVGLIQPLISGLAG